MGVEYGATTLFTGTQVEAARYARAWAKLVGGRVKIEKPTPA